MILIKIYLATVVVNLIIMSFFLVSEQFVIAYNNVYRPHRRLYRHIPILLSIISLIPIINIIFIIAYLLDLSKPDIGFSEIIVNQINDNLNKKQ